MWPFKRTASTPNIGDYIEAPEWCQGSALADLAPDEREDVERVLRQFSGKKVLRNWADRVFGAVAAAELSNLASGLIRDVVALESGSYLAGEIPESERQLALADMVECRERAVWLAKKAVELYPHPVLFPRLAKVLRQAGKTAEGDSVMEAQHDRERAWNKSQIDQGLLIGLMPDEESTDAAGDLH